MSSSYGIITGANSVNWICLSALAIGAHKNKIGFAIADHGLEKWQRTELERIGIQWIEHKKIDLPKLNTNSVDLRAWWKPWICQASPFEKSIWIDNDSVIIGDITPLFKYDLCVGNHKIWIGHRRWIQSQDLAEKIFDKDRLKNYYLKTKDMNCGVIGFTKNNPFIQEWIDMTEYLFKNKELLDLCVAKDQNAFILTCIKRLIENKDIPYILENKYNYPAEGLNNKYKHKRKKISKNPNLFLKDTIKKNPKQIIVHWISRPKPWELIESDKYDPIDILIPLGSGSRYKNLEIKMALRSIEKYALGYRKIFIIGQIPNFLYESDRLKLISKKDFKCNKESRISQKVKWAFENLDLTSRIAFWNDDYLLLKESDVRLIPNYHKGKLFRKNNTGYSKYLNITHYYLSNKNLPTFNYDGHIPIIYDREKFLSISDQWEDSRKHKLGFVAKSIYGNNFCHNNAERLGDIKLANTWNKNIDTIMNNKRWLISYGDNALNSGFDKWMINNFPNKSIFEEKAATEKCCNNRTMNINNYNDIDNDPVLIWKKAHEAKIQ